MDLVRYCESHGSQGDPELPNAWRYRDYLIRAFNEDVPYDRLVREHLAGDLLPDPRWNKAESFNESAIGPAHLRMVELGFVPVDALEDQVKVVDNQIDVVSKTFLGLTVSCSRCHNHKFDPISQEDYYALYGVLASCRPGEVLIDSPDLIQKNRADLVTLKQTIRDELAEAWLKSAAKLANRLQEQSRREAEIALLTVTADRVRDEISAIAAPAQAKLLKARGHQGDGKLPVPTSRWSFDRDASDGLGRHHGELQGGATVRNGRLILNGVDAYMTTAPLEQDFREKTFEAWVMLADLDQRGGGVIGLESLKGGLFDSIVFGELTPRNWMAGSDFFRRSNDPGGPAETAKTSDLIHIAVVYRADNTILLYRNGQPYGKPYQKGTLQPFSKGGARFLFGYRLSNAKPPLAGEIEEARVYDRALTAEEAAASFRAGPAGVSAEDIAAELSEDDRKKFAGLRSEQARLAEQLSRLRSGTDHDTWGAALEDSRTNKANPLSLWRQAFKDDGQARSAAEIRESWSKAVVEWQTELTSRRDFNAKNFTTAWDLTSGDSQTWFRAGPGLTSAPSAPGEFSIEPAGDRVIRGVYPAGIFTHRVSSKHPGTLTSPRFKIDTDSVFIRALGRKSTARIVIENYPLGNGGIYPATRPERDEMGWIRLDTAYRKGANAYLEFATGSDERAFFGASQIATGNLSEAPRESTVPIQSLLEGEAPESLQELASRYGESLQKAIRSWKCGVLSEQDAAFLDFFVRRELLPTTLADLPRLKDAVERYRTLESEIPAPRKAPGVLETEAFDQPLFVRGVHTRPGRPVPRRGLSLFGGARFKTTQSGRLELAMQLAAAENPLTSRVMVNRIWHYLFGRGIVPTVDNFGRLGDTPSHPELLDYLADRFVREGWSTKKMIRLLVTSRAYQQSSQSSVEAARNDPLNVWLTHMPVRRLEAEAIRDAILTVTGELDTAMYGSGVNVYYVTKTEGGGPKGPLNGDRRRSIYLRVRRNAQNPFLESFNAPKPSTTRGKRDSTNVPAQSLTMLNDPFVIDQALQWSRRLMNEPAEPTERIRSMYVRAIGREPTSSERKSSLLYLNDLLEEHKSAATESDRQESRLAGPGPRGLLPQGIHLCRVTGDRSRDVRCCRGPRTASV